MLFQSHQRIRFRVLTSGGDACGGLLDAGYSVQVGILDFDDPNANGGGEAVGHILQLDTPQAVVEALWNLLYEIAPKQANT